MHDKHPGINRERQRLCAVSRCASKRTACCSGEQACGTTGTRAETRGSAYEGGPNPQQSGAAGGHSTTATTFADRSKKDNRPLGPLITEPVQCRNWALAPRSPPCCISNHRLPPAHQFHQAAPLTPACVSCPPPLFVPCLPFQLGLEPGRVPPCGTASWRPLCL